MFEELLSKIAKTLSAKNIPYMVIGGQAVLLYGEPRLTRDIDITLGANTDRIQDLLDVVESLSLKPLPENPELFVRQTMVLPAADENTGIRVDFIFSFSAYEAEAIKRVRRIEIRGTGVCFASPEDVIIHKIFAGRPRDIEDVKSIILKNQHLDMDYIHNWLKEFDAASDEKSFLTTFEQIIK